MGEVNVTFGWIWINAGILMGMVMGLWSFAGPLKPPKGFEDYSSLPRRFVRLGHVAFMVLSLLNVLYGREMANAALSDNLKIAGSYSMVLAAIGMPLGCTAAAFRPSFKYFLVLPASLFLVATAIMAYGVMQ